MKPKTMILMAVAIACGLGASFMTSRLLADRSNQGDAAEEVTVVVAKKTVPMGEVIKNPQEWFEHKKVAAGSEPTNSITELDKLKGKQIKNPRRKGDFVTTDDFYGPDDQGIASRLPAGHLAVGIRVNPDQIAGGFASLPHSKVDIFSTVRRGDDKSTYSMLLLEDVLVLAADQATGRDAESKAQLASVVTLALKPDEVTKLRLAEQMGPLSLALRPFGERRHGGDYKTTFQQIITHTAGKVGDQIIEGGDGHSAPPIFLAPSSPGVGKDVTPIAQKEGRHKTMYFILGNAGQQQVFEYILDEKGNVISSREVPPGGFSESPRTAPAVAAPAAPAPTPAPAPKGPESKG